MPLVTLTAHISFSRFQTGHSFELESCSVELQLRHLMGAEQGEPSCGVSPHFLHRGVCLQNFVEWPNL